MTDNERVRNRNSSEPDDEDQSTGLRFPRTWKGSYIAVIIIFLVWVALLIALGEIF